MYAPQSKRTRIYATALLILIMVGGHLGSPVAFAEEFSSSNFTLINPWFSSFGGYSTSSNFSLLQSGDQMADGNSTSTSFGLEGGPLYFGSTAAATQNWRWYDDEGNETPTTTLAAENTAPANIDDLDVIKLRLSVADTAGAGIVDTKFRLQYATSSTFANGASDLHEIGDCTATSTWCYADGGGNDNEVITTKVLTDADSCTGSTGNGCGLHNESGTTTPTFTHAASAVAEYEFTVQRSGGQNDTTYFFRLFDVNSSAAVPLNTGETYPSLLTGGTTLTFSIGGVASSTVTEGVTTDVDTTPTSVPFGSLTLGTSTIAAHRLTVSTNASNGFKVYTYQRQDLENSSGNTVDPVTSTNATPAGWSTGCTGGASGCYGYHTGEDVLEGGSTRFAPDDSYAQFADTVEEVAYAAGPVSNEEVDIVYRVEVDGEQEAGQYESAIVYIVTPVF